jgi:hypothetical protein
LNELGTSGSRAVYFPNNWDTTSALAEAPMKRDARRGLHAFTLVVIAAAGVWAHPLPTADPQASDFLLNVSTA